MFLIRNELLIYHLVIPKRIEAAQGCRPILARGPELNPRLLVPYSPANLAG